MAALQNTARKLIFFDLVKYLIKEAGVMRGQDRCIKGFVRETGGKETTWKI